jgi:hypothetical protein
MNRSTSLVARDPTRHPGESRGLASWLFTNPKPLDPGFRQDDESNQIARNRLAQSATAIAPLLIHEKAMRTQGTETMTEQHPSHPHKPKVAKNNDASTGGHGELVLYATDDGAAKFYLRAEGGTAWLTQLELAELFQTSKQNISLHVKNVLSEGELMAGSVVKEDLTTATDGKRYRTSLYNLDMILAIGYRVKSPRGTQFRQWASTHLKEYLIKGFVLDDQRLKEPGGWDYFDELLERIRDIRTSEKRFYQKIRDVFALSIDYRDDEEASGQFFAMVQNKMLFAVTQKTAAEIVVERADADHPNMALTNWSTHRVRKTDVIIAKNYLNHAELDELNRIASMFLDFAEDRTARRLSMHMDDWRQFVDRFMEFNERPLLKNAGSISSEQMQKIAHERHEQFHVKRKRDEALVADAEDIKELESLDKQNRKGGKHAP